MPRSYLRLVVGLAMLAGCAAPIVAVPPADTGGPSVVLVRFLPETDAAARAALRQRYATSADPGAVPETERWHLQSGAQVAAVLDSLGAEPGIKYAAINHKRHIQAFAASDLTTGATGQWHLEQIRVPEAWSTYFSAEHPPGQGVVVAVLDSGVDTEHPDLQANIARTSTSLPITDRQSRAYLDVLHDASGSADSCRGYNYDWPTAYQDGSHPGPDGHGHGTHVAGLIAAVANNAGYGARNLVGVAPGAQILPVKTMDCNGDGDDWTIAAGIVQAADHGAKIENLSIGGPEPSQILEDAIAYARARGVLLVMAAGNGYASPIYYPAAYAGVLAVGAVDSGDGLTSYSNVGPELALVAPGGGLVQNEQGVLSTLPSYSSTMGRDARGACYYGRVSGTSQASPIAAGVAALIWSREPSLTADQVRDRLIASAQDLGSSGFDRSFGWGRVDAAAALALGDHRYAAP